ncbi:hypothetical protein M2103_002456 [Ereboglobus sp. PH5-5]|uniref:hypothetical protein n=1 Tax=Ereboglobus sp. PH5-5 TaxID=2940529 RepID=UPI0024076A23|nr:hypothetical protein [Ereboglobus sp. PH5-5]MDF9834214.1 hypothetical protein [Ereboglobus sp. PH5-5]
MKKIILLALLAFVPLLARAQSSAPYTDGPVWEMTLVRTKHGMADEYLRSITKTFWAVMEEAKKQGIIMDFKVFYGLASSPSDYDVILLTQTKDMAYRDKARELLDPIVIKLEGNTAKQRETTSVRLDMRDVLGYKLMREIYLDGGPAAKKGNK